MARGGSPWLNGAGRDWAAPARATTVAEYWFGGSCDWLCRQPVEDQFYGGAGIGKKDRLRHRDRAHRVGAKPWNRRALAYRRPLHQPPGAAANARTHTPDKPGPRSCPRTRHANPCACDPYAAALPAAPGAFDFPRLAWFASLGAVGFTTSRAKIESTDASASWTGAVQLLPALPGWGLAVVTLGGLWLFLWRRTWRYAGIAGILAGGLAIATADTPDILIDGDAKQVAVRDQTGGLRVSGRANSFVAETWLRRDGIASAVRWPRRSDRRPADDGGVRCDELGCVTTIDGQTVAIAYTRGALEDDCRRADIIISFVPVRGPCPSAHLVVDRFDLWRSGAHAIWLSGGGIRVETASHLLGRRPWVATHRRVRALEERVAATP